MDKQMMIYLAIGVVIGFIIGFILTNMFSKKGREFAKVKRELEQTQEELKTQKQTIVKHFSHSAEILDNMAKEFRRLYQHMAENSGKFSSDDDITAIALDMNKDADIKTEITLEKQPKDYSDNPSGLFKTDENKS
ncbi:MULTISPECIES: YhcB family protein [unclassified Gilliamella]|uniref:YhcB family protein n=1 Tax=unclassified Gilliamella TaxID=2685620 RepID=UPI00226A96FC|nr:MULTISPECIES: DUF1043 family protein [unclassified Gilliamella]MCX8641416.1 YhcB family protein [Gilliamella sp. B3835]MCX8707526.1 YhcB family protein [Gilliamella sp. B3783]MCX8710606.1 YhcB family protein [Gilliamella sp. B3780]MCX8711222.1 YhcB family protein [Gilliamella sp. B3468]MCX8714721.1 YhcB family protein [Gilliamella sp. B3781]